MQQNGFIMMRHATASETVKCSSNMFTQHINSVQQSMNKIQSHTHH
jgi:hypothetical protein